MDNETKTSFSSLISDEIEELSTQFAHIVFSLYDDSEYRPDYSVFQTIAERCVTKMKRAALEADNSEFDYGHETNHKPSDE